MGLREAWKLRDALAREQEAADPLPGVIVRSPMKTWAIARAISSESVILGGRPGPLRGGRKSSVRT